MFEKISVLLLAGIMFLGSPKNTEKVDYKEEMEVDFKEEIYLDKTMNTEFKHKITDKIDLHMGTKESPVSIGQTHIMKVDQKDLQGNVKSNNINVRIDSVERLADTEKETPKETCWIKANVTVALEENEENLAFPVILQPHITPGDFDNGLEFTRNGHEINNFEMFLEVIRPGETKKGTFEILIPHGNFNNKSLLINTGADYAWFKI